MKTEVNLKVADKELRKIVEELKEKGLPEMVPLTDDVLKNLEDNQQEVLCVIARLAKARQKIDDKKIGADKKKEELNHINVRIREELQKAIKMNLIHLGFIQKHVVAYGAIPDPEQGWKYYYLLSDERNYACWHCGEEILVKNQTVSLHDGPFALSGSGRVKSNKVVYCPKCDGTPPDSGIERVDPMEELEEEMKIFAGKK